MNDEAFIERIAIGNQLFLFHYAYLLRAQKHADEFVTTRPAQMAQDLEADWAVTLQKTATKPQRNRN